MGEGEGQASAGGLRAEWGVAHARSPQAGEPGSGAQGQDFQEAFGATLSAIGADLQSLKSQAEAVQHQAMDGLRQQLVAQFQKALLTVDPGDPSLAQSAISGVLAAADALKSRAASAAQEAAAMAAQWQARAAEFETALTQIAEMSDAGSPNAASFQAVADRIRTMVDARKLTDALAILDRFLQSLATAYAEQLAQKKAQANGLLDSVTSTVSAALQQAKGVAEGLADGASKAVSTAKIKAQGVADQVSGLAKGAANSAGEAIVESANAVGDSAATVGGDAGEAVGAVLGTGISMTVAKGLVDPDVVASGTTLGQAIGGDAGEWFGGKVADAAHWVAGAVGGAMAPPSEPSSSGLTGRPRSNAVISTTKPPVAFKPVKGADGRTLQVGQAPDGKVTLLAPPPPIETLTFSGGGGKGAALPGAVRALEDSGVLKDVKVVTGASVGSMTAALVAGGITADEFKEIGNREELSDQIKGGKSTAEVLFDGGLSGEGLEEVVRQELSRSVSKRILEYVKAQTASGGTPDPHVLEIAQRLADGKSGVTFRDLRDLSKVIPAIKEVAISGSFMCEVDPKTGNPVKGTENSQLVIFNADTEPDLEVALAVHASASLPPVFKPVDIKLANGTKARFQDGGVLNNAPTLESIGAERQLDPMPDSGSMTFIFEDDASRDVLKGQAAPTRSRVNDWFTDAENSAADYAKNRALADRPQDVVMLPLTYTLPPEDEDGDPEEKDFSGFFSGTVNFDMELDDKLKLQELAEGATSNFLKSRDAAQPHEYASMEQMLMSVPRDDLAAMATQGLSGAKEALDFRDKVTAEVASLIPLVTKQANTNAAAKNREVLASVARLEQLAGQSTDRQMLVAREVNRSPRLDDLFQALRSPGCGDTLKACGAVNDGLRARAHAKEVLRDPIYPKMVRTDPDGIDGGLLKQVDDMLRTAESPEDVNAALTMAIEHFSKRRDLLGLKGHKAFAKELQARLMK